MAAPAIRTVPASTGFAWARQGLDALAAAPAVWIGIVLLFVVMGVVLSIIPLAGILWSVIVPIHIGGLMIGCRALARGEPLEIRHLFNGFEAPRLQPLALVGALYLAGSLIVIVPLVVIIAAGVAFSAVTLAMAEANWAVLIGVAVLGTIVLLLAIAGSVGLSLALWFAPALVVFDGLEALDALKLSLRAGWANIGAFAVFSLALLILGVVMMSPLLATIVMVAANGGGQPGAVALMMLGVTGLLALLWIVVAMPVAWGAMYASYEDTLG